MTRQRAFKFQSAAQTASLPLSLNQISSAALVRLAYPVQVPPRSHSAYESAQHVGTLKQVETTATAEASTVARLGHLVEAAAAQRSPLEGAVARFAKYYTPLVLIAALCIAFIPWASGHKSHKVEVSIDYTNAVY